MQVRMPDRALRCNFCSSLYLQCTTRLSRSVKHFGYAPDAGPALCRKYFVRIHDAVGVKLRRVPCARSKVSARSVYNWQTTASQSIPRPPTCSGHIDTLDLLRLVERLMPMAIQAVRRGRVSNGCCCLTYPRCSTSTRWTCISVHNRGNNHQFRSVLFGRIGRQGGWSDLRFAFASLDDIVAA